MTPKREFPAGTFRAIAIIDIIVGAFYAACSVWVAPIAVAKGAPMTSVIVGAVCAAVLVAIGVWLLFWVRSKTKRQ